MLWLVSFIFTVNLQRWNYFAKMQKYVEDLQEVLLFVEINWICEYTHTQTLQKLVEQMVKIELVRQLTKYGQFCFNFNEHTYMNLFFCQ